ncbi:PIN domain-containing protein [Meinhardsimonia xiamenensis]|jgi:predicted nucleic acid-binding protein|uniref:PIN domain-containing protein n=1 Tax=Meinhardsimonia xiamenensis TaxID=990712 RepID=A0A1G9B3Y3_9RHOB|nr:PIN domain-containing protein [Meinhardsimonia xiamenensis]PRX35131.1 PIN domain-containing protein [Meinhardsimonia xiamenensis]SDK34219.1 PIN domain-containing protein [Meinhardsimonia xiamenensis]
MRAVLDACVLVPLVPRLIFLSLAASGLIEPVWSQRLLEEWRRVAERRGAVDAAAAEADAVVMRMRWPEGEVPPRPDLEARYWLPDESDVHVLATAIAGRAQTIITFNTRDFPRAALAPHGLIALHPDAFLTERLAWDEEPLRQAAEDARETVTELMGAEMPMRAMLKAARLPRFARRLTSG